MYKIIWKPVKYINYIINNGLVLYPGKRKQNKMKQKKRPADCASPGGHAGDLHQGWQSDRGQLSERSQVKLTCLFFFFLVIPPKQHDRGCSKLTPMAKERLSQNRGVWGSYTSS